MSKQKPSFNPSKNNSAGPLEKTSETKDIPGLSDDVYSEEENREGEMDDRG